MRFLLIDNYDSFTFNLSQLFRSLGVRVEVYRNDRISLDMVREISPDGICLSPGPGTPQDSGICPGVVKAFGYRIPLFGVCLGMQVINEVFGGKTVKAGRPVHGKTSAIHHDGHRLFNDIPSPFYGARYHSLQAVEVPSPLRVVAHASDRTIMGLAHVAFPVFGVQYHPESFLTEHGCKTARNFLDICADHAGHSSPEVRQKTDSPRFCIDP